MYHISIAWSGMACEIDSGLCRMLERDFPRIVGTRVSVRQVKLKIGNEISTVSLKDE